MSQSGDMFGGPNVQDLQSGETSGQAQRTVGDESPLFVKETPTSVREKNAEGKAVRHPILGDYDGYKGEDDPYERTETREGTTEKQKSLGRAAIAALQRWIGLDRDRRRRTPARGGQGTVSILGSRMYKGFIAGRPQQLIGQKIETAKDLAFLAQVYRDPRFETLRVVYTRNGSVVGEEGFTSRLPGVARAPDNFSGRIAAAMREFNADGYYLMHNHPSGRAAASSSDVNLTRQISNQAEGFRGHIIIDHNEFCVIDKHGNSKVVQAPELGATDFRSNPEKPHPLLGKILNSPKAVADLAKDLQVKNGHATIVALDAGGEVQIIADMPLASVKDTSDKGLVLGKAFIRRLARRSGASGPRFIVLPMESRFEEAMSLGRWVHQGVVSDVVTGEGLSLRLRGYPGGDDFLNSGEKVIPVREQTEGYLQSVQTGLSGENKPAAQQAPSGLMFSRAKTDAEKAAFLNGPPIKILTGEEGPAIKAVAPLRTWATKLFESQGSVANSPELGPVALTSRSVRDSLGHSLSSHKIAAFAAVKDVIEKGEIVYSELKRAEMNSFYIAAPVSIGGVDDIVTVLVRRDVNSQRMYLHSVAVRESLRQHQVPGAGTIVPKRSGSSTEGGIQSVLTKLLNFKQESAPVKQDKKFHINQRNNADALAEEASRVQSAIEGKGLIDAARFMTQSKDQAKAEVAKQVLNKLERLQSAGVNLDLKIVHRGDMVPSALTNGRGYTETGFDAKGRDITVWLNGADVTGKVGADEETLLHELVHAATTGMVYYGRTNPNSIIGQQVRNLMAVTDAIANHISQRFADADAGKTQLTEFEQDMREGANNAFRSDDEVLAWALSSPEAQNYLESIPYGKANDSLWSKFVQAVRVLLGLPANNATALSEVLSVGEKLMAANADTTGRAAFWHKRGIPMSQQQAEGSIVQQRGDGPMFSTATEQAGHPDDFVQAPDGSLDFGEISLDQAKAMRRQPGKIRLTEGVQNADRTGYGLAHIEANHGEQIRNAGFGSVQDFISYIANNFDEILQGQGRQLLVAATGGRQNVMFVQLEPNESGDYYRINSAFPTSRNYLQKQMGKGMTLLWGGSEPSPTVAGKQPLYAGKSESESGQTAPIAQGRSSEQNIAQGDQELQGRSAEPKRSVGLSAAAYDIARRVLLGNQEPKSMVAGLQKELAGKVGTLGDRIHVVQSILDLPAAERRQIYNSQGGMTGIQGVYFPDSEHAYLIADNIAPGHAYATLLHEAGVHAGLRGMIGDEGMQTLSGQIRAWAESGQGEEGRIAKAAMDRVPSDRRMALALADSVAWQMSDVNRGGQNVPHVPEYPE